MAYTAVHKHAPISATKVRPIADLIRGKLADEALELLQYHPQRGAKLLHKVLKSALANAEDRRATHLDHMVVVDARADVGSMYKRVRPRARGMAHVIKKRLSHLTVSVDLVEGVE